MALAFRTSPCVNPLVLSSSSSCPLSQGGAALCVCEPPSPCFLHQHWPPSPPPCLLSLVSDTVLFRGAYTARTGRAPASTTSEGSSAHGPLAAAFLAARAGVGIGAGTGAAVEPSPAWLSHKEVLSMGDHVAVSTGGASALKVWHGTSAFV